VIDALGLLTRVPVRFADPDRPGTAAFGIVGAGVGLLGAIPLVLLGGLAEPWLAAIGALAAMVVTTGALHLDGLADTADALLAQDREAADRARKDPAAGSGGVIALVLALTAEIAALASLIVTTGPGVSALVLVAIASTSRVVPVVAVLVRAPGEIGSAGWFAARVSPADAVLAVATAGLVVLAAAAVLGLAAPGSAWVVVTGAASALLVGLLATAAIIGARGGLDGDGLGAAIELSMVAGLVAAAVVAR
jgi:adenosylcobinamide-GDP ribazoletransferase